MSLFNVQHTVLSHNPDSTIPQYQIWSIVPTCLLSLSLSVCLSSLSLSVFSLSLSLSSSLNLDFPLPSLAFFFLFTNFSMHTFFGSKSFFPLKERRRQQRSFCSPTVDKSRVKRREGYEWKEGRTPLLSLSLSLSGFCRDSSYALLLPLHSLSSSVSFARHPITITWRPSRHSLPFLSSFFLPLFFLSSFLSSLLREREFSSFQASSSSCLIQIHLITHPIALLLPFFTLSHHFSRGLKKTKRRGKEKRKKEKRDRERKNERKRKKESIRKETPYSWINVHPPSDRDIRRTT